MVERAAAPIQPQRSAPRAKEAAAQGHWPVPWQPVWGNRDGLEARAETLLASAALGLTSRLPEPLLARTITALARVARRLDRRHAHSARVFLETALGAMPKKELEARVLEAYRHFFRVTVETVQLNRLSRDEIEERLEVVWTDEARRARDGETGCVCVSAHLGNWEATVAVAPILGFDPFYGVAKPARNRPLSKLIQRDREQHGVRLLPRRGAMKAAAKILRAGGTLGLLLDQRARVKPILVPFFARPARCDRSAGVLLRRLRAPIVVSACYRTQRPLHFRVEFKEVLWPDELAGATPFQITARVNAALERAILQAPEQYFWLHDRYKDTPREVQETCAGAPGGYPSP